MALDDGDNRHRQATLANGRATGPNKLNWRARFFASPRSGFNSFVRRSSPAVYRFSRIADLEEEESGAMTVLPSSFVTTLICSSLRSFDSKMSGLWVVIRI